MSVEAVAAATAARGSPDARPGEHFAQVYEDDTVLLDAVSSYVREGLQTGAAAVVIATREHLDALGSMLRNARLGEVGTEQLILIDAQQMLASLLDGEQAPQREAFMRHV